MMLATQGFHPVAKLQSFFFFERLITNRAQVLNKEFYHLTSASLEVKNNTPNNVAFKINGKSTHEGATSGLV